MQDNLHKLEAVLRNHNAEGFIEAVKAGAEKPDRTIMTNLHGFYHEPDLLYAALLYASKCRVAVIVMPGEAEENSAA
jgi:hypothetical protein